MVTTQPITKAIRVPWMCVVALLWIVLLAEAIFQP
jgi:hypothetical protein